MEENSEESNRTGIKPKKSEGHIQFEKIEKKTQKSREPERIREYSRESGKIEIIRKNKQYTKNSRESKTKQVWIVCQIKF